MGTTIKLTGADNPVALQSDLDALTARVTKLESEIGPTPPLKPSPTNTFIQKAGAPPIVDDKLTQWTLVTAIPPATGLQIAVQPQGQAGVVDKPTQNVTQLGIQLVGGNRTIVQANAAGAFYENPTGVSGAWSQFGGPVPPGAPSAGITVAGGQLVHAGAPIVLKGLAVLDATMGTTPPSGIRSLFGPGPNAIMLAIGADGGGYQTARPNSEIVAYVQACNAAGFWVGLSDYVPGQPQGRSGQDLQNSLAWYVALSKAVAGMQVFWTTENEVQGPLDANLQAIYGALRGAGDQNLIMIQPSWPTSITPATVAGMEGVCWNIHIYPWTFASLPPTQAAYDAGVLGQVEQWQNFGHSLDGVMPVVNGETGNATSGNGGPIDDPFVDGKFIMTQATLDAMGKNPGLAGNLYWLHDWHGGGGNADTLVVNGALTQWGQQVAAGLG
jgi:hypothetical protein